ncbi:MAG: DUF721 domain-containing protein [Crocinitomicaceae bacterium]|nr:DUF721 domain-containing protein [Crocinitomicaceae bacterium]
MKKSDRDGISMNDAMQHYLKAIGIDQKVHEAAVLARWVELMGEAVAKRTEKKYIKDRILHIELNSSVMRDELMQQRSKIVDKVNKASGIDIVDEVFLA